MADLQAKFATEGVRNLFGTRNLEKPEFTAQWLAKNEKHTVHINKYGTPIMQK